MQTRLTVFDAMLEQLSGTHSFAAMKLGFTPIALDDYVVLHLRANPGTHRAEVEKHLRSAMAANRAGARCLCGEPIWMVGSAQVGLGCFTCITGEAAPSGDYEIEVSTEAP